VVEDFRLHIAPSGPRGHDDQGDPEAETNRVAWGNAKAHVLGEFPFHANGGNAVCCIARRGGYPLVVEKLSPFVLIQNEHSFGIQIFVTGQNGNDFRHEFFTVLGVSHGVFGEALRGCNK